MGIKIIGIMAVDPNGVIGDRGKLPWDYPDDRAWFRKMILGQVVIMGRKTFEAIDLLHNPTAVGDLCVGPVLGSSCISGYTPVLRSGPPTNPLTSAGSAKGLMPSGLLSECTPIVFSRGKLDGCTVVHSLDELLELFAELVLSKAYLVGGAEIAHLFLQRGLIDEFFLTRVHASYPGDTRLNLDLFKGWREEVLKQTPEYRLCKLTPTDCHPRT